ncbi:MAG: NFACT family protein [Candidatus Diapherotrites archaeon]|uniref:NFACT family protein n=1 Tax=Candidatus Iainarchaeum sp. TaxID=3101447 RepID=A0A8T4KXS4_9ARCH|nr:NFACT family protein [Candidatus Diapherotrites archaeon]
MQLFNLALAYLVEELKPLVEKSFLNKVQLLQKGVLKLKIHSGEGPKDIIITPSSFFLTSFRLPAGEGSSPLIQSMKKHLLNRRISCIEQQGLDRIVKISFEEYFLFLEFVQHSNIILTDKELTILAVQNPREWRDRSLKRGSPYKLPPQQGISPLEINEKPFSSALKESKTDLARAIIREINISPLAAEEILFNLGLEKHLAASSLQEKQAGELAKAIKEFHTVSLEKLAPVKVGSSLLPFRFNSLQEKQESVSSLNRALDEAFAASFKEGGKKEAESTKSKEVERLEVNFREQLKAKERFEAQIEENRKRSELIYSHYNDLEEIVKAVKALSGKGLNEKEIMYKIKSVAGKNRVAAENLQSVDLKKKQITLEF